MISNIIKSVFGDKSSKDRKDYQPIIDKSNSVAESLKNISDDELRGKTAEFKSIIKERTADLEKELKDLRDRAMDSNTSVHEREDLFAQKK